MENIPVQTLAEKASSEQNWMDESGFGKTFGFVFLTRKECIPQHELLKGCSGWGCRSLGVVVLGMGGEGGDCILHVTFMREQKLGSFRGKTNPLKQQTSF